MSSSRMWEVREISDQKVVKVAISHLFERFSAELGPRALQELPTTSDGSPLVKQATFFKGLLSREFELKSVAPGGVSAAQSELRHLSAAQLLAIRVRTLDFVTESVSHDAHNGFLLILDALLLEKLATSGLANGGGGEPPRDLLREIGLKMMMVVGAAQVLAAAAPVESGGEPSPPTPRWWAMKMSGPVRATLVRRDDLSVFLLDKQTRGEVSRLVGGEPVAVVLGKAAPVPPYGLDWAVRALDPCRQDIVAELHMSKGWVIEARKELGLDLATVLQHRRYLPDSDDEGDRGKGASPQKPSGFGDNEDDYLKTPQKGKVSSQIQNFETATPSPLDPKGTGRMSASPLWTMNGWRWQRDPNRLRILSDLDSTKESSTEAPSSSSRVTSPTDEELKRLAELFEPPPEPAKEEAEAASPPSEKKPPPTAFADGEYCGLLPCLGPRSADGQSGMVWFINSFKTCGAR